MNQITFRNVHTFGQIFFENDLYKHTHHSGLLKMYDANFIEFKKMPEVEEFEGASDYLRSFHLKNGQNHVKFYLPENQRPSLPLLTYLNENGYNIGYLELFGIKPNHFPALTEKPEISVLPVTEDRLNTYLDFQYKIDLEYGEEFAMQKANLYRKNFESDSILQILAFYNRIPAGAVDVIINEDTVEIDNLIVLEEYRNRGIGGRLQKFVMDQFPDKMVILVADGEDTPREMYIKQNYQYLAFKYHVLKVFDQQ